MREIREFFLRICSFSAILHSREKYLYSLLSICFIKHNSFLLNITCLIAFIFKVFYGRISTDYTWPLHWQSFTLCVGETYSFGWFFFHQIQCERTKRKHGYVHQSPTKILNFSVIQKLWGGQFLLWYIDKIIVQICMYVYIECCSEQNIHTNMHTHKNYNILNSCVHTVIWYMRWYTHKHTYI